MRLNRSRESYSRPSGVVLLVVVFLWQQSVCPSFSQTINTQSTNAPQLKIVVLEGEDGVNIIKKNTAVKPVVEVRDKNNLPVAGVYVTFIAPGSGPHVIFAHGSTTYSTVTNASGRATIHIMKPVGQGAFKINVNASFQGQTATTTIAQTNYPTVADATASGVSKVPKSGISGVKIGLIVGALAVAAGVAAAVVETRGGGKPPTSTTAPTKPTDVFSH